MPVRRRGEPWPEGKPRCTATVRNPNSDHVGEQCMNPPIQGGTVCRFHGGQLPRVRAAGQKRLARAKVGAELVRMGERIEGLDPTDVLLGLVWEAAGNVAFLRRKVQLLEQGYVGRIYSEARIGRDGEPEESGDSEPGDGIVGPTHLGDGGQHVYVQMYGEWCEKLAKFSKMAIEAGIVERQVRLAEQQAELMAQVIRGVLADLEIPATPETLKIVGRHLALAAGPPDLGEKAG